MRSRSRSRIGMKMRRLFLLFSFSLSVSLSLCSWMPPRNVRGTKHLRVSTPCDKTSIHCAVHARKIWLEEKRERERERGDMFIRRGVLLTH